MVNKIAETIIPGMTVDDFNAKLSSSSHKPHECIRFIMHIWPQYIWQARDILNVLRLEYSEEQFSKTLFYRHLQVLKNQTRITKVEGGWTLNYPQFEYCYKAQKPGWFSKWPFLRECHFHEPFEWDKINPHK